jgi:hypothetical protein
MDSKHMNRLSIAGYKEFFFDLGALARADMELTTP